MTGETKTSPQAGQCSDYVLSDDPNGASTLKSVFESSLNAAKQLILFAIYYERDTASVRTTTQRNEQIRKRYTAGESLSDLAREYGISPQRIYQIVRKRG